MKLAFRSLCAAVALLLVAGALSFAQAQTPSSTPDPFVAQLTFSPPGLQFNPFGSFASDLSANGRFAVIESNGDIATDKSVHNNADGNREIFLFDYAQRRIYQITDTKNVQKPPASPTPTPTPTPTPSPSASPTPTPAPTPADFTNVAVEISNNRPMISLEPPLSAGQRVYTIVFSSNAPNPGGFDGTASAALSADGNQEVWIYQFTATEASDLSSGAEIAVQDLSAGSFTQITNTAASGVPRPGGVGPTADAGDDVYPYVADDNREAAISDNGRLIAFVSVRSDDLVHTGDTNGSPEVFLFNRDTATFTQVTTTGPGTLVSPIFTQNPSLSGGGTGVLAFVSNANITGDNDDGGGKGNAEIFVVNYNGGTVSGMRQVTKTKTDATGVTVNLFHFGRRVSRDGSMLAFESLANDPKVNGSITQVYVTFVYNIGTDTFTQVGPRATTFQDIFTFPTFTDYNATLNPGSVAFASIQNFRPDGTLPEAGKESEGLNNTNQAPQIFLAPVPVASSGPFTRLTNIPSGSFVIGIRPCMSNTRRRLAFSLDKRELGGGNSDGSTETYYQLSPQVTSEPTATISLFTGASQIPVAVPSASPTPTPTPAPLVAPGLAAGELAIARATVPLAPSSVMLPSNAASESTRSPALPVELNGVSVSIGGAAAGLYAVSSTEINFVVPIGLIPNAGTANVSYPIVINIHNDGAGTGTAIRGTVVIVAAQPDIFTTTNGPGGRAIVCNITNSLSMGCLGEPFTVTSTDSTGATVPTVLEIKLTGVRSVARTAVSVKIGTTDITGDGIVFIGPTDMPGFDKLDVRLPASLAAAGDVTVIVTVGTATSRPADTAPRIQIN